MAAIGLVIIISYLIGSIPFAYIIAKKVKGIDIRYVGDGNVGARNVMHTVSHPYRLHFNNNGSFITIQSKHYCLWYRSLSYWNKTPYRYSKDEETKRGILISSSAIRISIFKIGFPKLERSL